MADLELGVVEFLLVSALIFFLKRLKANVTYICKTKLTSGKKVTTLCGTGSKPPQASFEAFEDPSKGSPQTRGRTRLKELKPSEENFLQADFKDFRTSSNL